MFMCFLNMCLLISGGFILSRILLPFCRQQPDVVPEYTFRTDPWLYLLCLTAAGLSLLHYFLPDFHDTVVAFPFWNLLIVLALGTLIYLMFLSESQKAFYVAVFLSCVVIVSLLPDNSFIFGKNLPFYFDRILGVCICFVMTVGLGILNRMYGIFSLQCLAVTTGLSLVALMGGVPLYLGFFGAWLTGLWLGFLNLNWYPGQIYLNQGACASAAFIFAALLLQGSVEMAEPAMLILIMYFLTEGLWVLKHCFMSRLKTETPSDGTVYMIAFANGLKIPAIGMSVAKVCIINVLLAAFQLYAPNPYSVPVFAFIINLWLLSILYSVSLGESPLTLKETNQKIIGDIRNGLRRLNKKSKETRRKNDNKTME